jgi:phosphinothricin acetyltransferase
VKIAFEPLGEAHRRAVMDIFNYYAENSFAAYPETKLPDALFDMFLETAKKYPAYAIKTDDDTVAGYCLLRPYIPMASFRETAEISYFVGKDYVGHGIGAEALRRLEDDAKKLGIRNILAGVVSRNEESLRFHRKHGFCECGCFRGVGKKFGEFFDIVWMQKVL